MMRGGLLPQLLFWLNCLCSVGLTGVVLGAPLVVQWTGGPEGQRWLQLFAEDVILRRVAITSALGLLVTGFVFFRLPRRQEPSPTSV